MDNSTILYIGMFCFAMTGLGVVLTAYEFKKMSPESEKKRLGSVELKANAVLRTAKVAEIQ
jgi:hypothetical protein